MEKTNCGNCGASFKVSLIGSNSPFSKEDVALINEYNADKKESYCSKCGTALLKEAKSQAEIEITSLKKIVQKNISNILLITITPSDVQYEICDMVTSQNVIGTGVISELSSDFNDLFGTRSNTLSSKLKKGEDLCKTQLRLQALDLGCHAVVGVDIDYSEMGSLRGMMMVCMSGTAIRYEMANSIGIEQFEKIKELIQTNFRLKYLSSLIDV